MPNAIPLDATGTTVTVAHSHDASRRRPALFCGVIGLLTAVLLAAPLAQARPGVPEHAIAMHGEPALPAGFDRLRYANPDAPKGGRLTQGILGTFDSINPFVVKGLALSQVRGYVVESLLARGYDEPFTLYGLLAKTVETDADRTYVKFELDPAARFSDGKPVTAADVVFSWELLRDKGRPNYRTYYAKVAKAEALSERVVRFDLTGADDRELPLILGLMPVLPKHAVDPVKFEDTTFEPIVGSGGDMCCSTESVVGGGTSFVSVGDVSFQRKRDGATTVGSTGPDAFDPWSQIDPAVQSDSAACSVGVHGTAGASSLGFQPTRSMRCVQSHVGLLATSRQSSIMPTWAGPPSNRRAAGSVKMDKSGGTNVASRI